MFNKQKQTPPQCKEQGAAPGCQGGGGGRGREGDEEVPPASDKISPGDGKHSTGNRGRYPIEDMDGASWRRDVIVAVAL